MKKVRLIGENGYSIVEILVAMAVFLIGISGAIVLIYNQQFFILDRQQSIYARFLSSEGIEAVKEISKNNWDSLTSGEHGLFFLNGQWQFLGNQDVKDEFVRKIVITDIDLATKKIQSRTTWQGSFDRNLNIELTTILTNWKKVLDSGGGPGSGDSGLSGDWTNPKTLVSADLGPGAEGTDVAVKNSIVFLSSVASDPKKPDLFVFDASSPSSIKLLKSLDICKIGLNSISLSGNYLFAASPHSIHEFFVFDVSSPANPQKIATLDLEGDGAGLTVFAKNNIAALGRQSSSGAEVYIINVDNPFSPQILSKIEIGRDVNDVFIDDSKRLYIASGRSNKELEIFDLNDPSNPLSLGFLDIFNQNGATSVFVKDSSRVFVGTSEKFFIINAAEPVNIFIRGSILVGGTINDIFSVGKLAFLATANSNREFQIINVADPTNPTLYSYFNFPQMATGVDYENNLVFLSVRSNDALRIIAPQ